MMELPERYWDTQQQRWVYPGELRPLPEPTAIVRRWTTNSVSVDIPPPLLSSLQDGERLYSADQMREYGESCARMAREQERERCALIAEGNYEAKTFGLTPSASQAGQIAAAIRKG